MQPNAIFKHPQFGGVRALKLDGVALFAARDIAAALSYKNPSSAIKQHCKGAARYAMLESGRGVQRTRIIEEPDVYRLITHAQTPAAKAFEHWVFGEVLPQINKTGGFINTEATDTDAEIMAKALVVAQRTIEAQKARAAELEAQAHKLEQSVQELKPKAEFYNRVAATNGLISMSELAKLICQNGVETGRTRLFKAMREDGFILKNSCLPTQKATEAGLIKIVEYIDMKPDGTRVLRLVSKIPPKGQEYFIRRYMRDKNQEGE